MLPGPALWCWGCTADPGLGPLQPRCWACAFRGGSGPAGWLAGASGAGGASLGQGPAATVGAGLWWVRKGWSLRWVGLGG